MFKKVFIAIGVLVVAFFVLTGLTIAAATLGKAPACPAATGEGRSEQQLIRLLEASSLTLSDAEATALAQKYLSDKIEDPRICFSPGALHLSGRLRLGRVKPSFYVSTGINLEGATPKTENLDIRVGSIPNLPIFTPVEKMIEGIINDNLSKAKFEEPLLIEFSEGSATIK